MQRLESRGRGPGSGRRLAGQRQLRVREPQGSTRRLTLSAARLRARWAVDGQAVAARALVRSGVQGVSNCGTTAALGAGNCVPLAHSEPQSDPVQVRVAARAPEHRERSAFCLWCPCWITGGGIALAAALPLQGRARARERDIATRNCGQRASSRRPASAACTAHKHSRHRPLQALLSPAAQQAQRASQHTSVREHQPHVPPAVAPAAATRRDARPHLTVALGASEPAAAGAQRDDLRLAARRLSNLSSRLPLAPAASQHDDC